MNSLERVTAVLERKETDRLPVYPLINSISRRYCGIDYAKWSQDVDLCVESIIKATEDIECDIITTLRDLSVEAADFGQKIIFPLDDACHPDMNDRYIKTIEDYKKVQLIHPRKTKRMAEQIEITKKLMDQKGNEVPIVSFVFGPLGILSMLRGQADMFFDCLESPEALTEPLEIITEVLIDYCDALIETGQHAIMFDTLYASQSIMSEAMWNEFEGGYIKKICDHVHKKGTMVMLHNCGKGLYMESQLELMRPQGVSFSYPSNDCSSFKETKEKYGDKTILIGAVSPSFLLDCTDEELIEKCESQIAEMNDGGGFILATGCEYPSGLDVHRAKVMVDIAKRTKSR